MISVHFHFSLSCIGEGNGNPLQCSCLENPRDGGAWWTAVSGVAQSQTRLKRCSSSSSGGDPRTKEQIKPRRVLECRSGETRPHHPSLPHVVTINGSQVLLSSITCLPPLPHREKVFALLFPLPVYMPHPISKWPTRPLSHSLYHGYKSGLCSLRVH